MPLYFPQLSQGISTQFPIRKALSFRTVLNANDRATTLRTADGGLERIAWWLQLRGLDDSERAAIENTFRSTKGPLETFVFLDPESNLLRHSEDLAAISWIKSPGLSLSPADSVPSPAVSATRIEAHPAQTAEIYQTLDLPCSYRWLLSLFARADKQATITLFVRSSHGDSATDIRLDPTWKRFSFGGVFWNCGNGIEVGIRFGAGTVADLSAVQLESQLSPSVYKRTGARSGVHPNARFAQDALRVTTLAPNCHQVNLTITAPISG